MIFLTRVGLFQVLEFTSLSDHCPILCSIYACQPVLGNNATCLSPLPDKFIWSENAIQSFKENVICNHAQHRLESFMKSDFKDTNSMVEAFNNILVDIAKKSAKLVKDKYLNFRKKKKKPWFTESCKELRNIVKNYEKLVNKFPFNASYRQCFYSFRARYRRKCKYEEKLHRQTIFTEINKSMNKNPKTFWNLINKLSHSHICENNAIPHNEFINHFKKLSSEEKDSQSFHKKINNEFNDLKKQLETNDTLNEFNDKISPEEIINTIKSLKNGKSTAADMISNEMLKYGKETLVKPLQKIFNNVFESGSFPNVWNENLIVPLHKKGPKWDPNNYRGLSVSSNLGKLFNKIIHT